MPKVAEPPTKQLGKDRPFSVAHFSGKVRDDDPDVDEEDLQKPVAVAPANPTFGEAIRKMEAVNRSRLHGACDRRLRRGFSAADVDQSHADGGGAPPRTEGGVFGQAGSPACRGALPPEARGGAGGGGGGGSAARAAAEVPPLQPEQKKRRDENARRASTAAFNRMLAEWWRARAPRRTRRLRRSKSYSRRLRLLRRGRRRQHRASPPPAPPSFRSPFPSAPTPPLLPPWAARVGAGAGGGGLRGAGGFASERGPRLGPQLPSRASMVPALLRGAAGLRRGARQPSAADGVVRSSRSAAEDAANAAAERRAGAASRRRLWTL